VPDVAIVGGGIVGAACAHELASRGLSVTLIERDELAAGASGRNQGWFVLSADPACLPMSELSLERYRGLVEDSPVPVWFDLESVGHLLFATDERAVDLTAARAAAWEAIGVRTERLDAAGLAREEPALGSGVVAAWLLDQGRRIDPGALTVAHALRAAELGARVLRHTVARALITAGERVTGVVTDDGVIAAGTVILAAGPWSAPFLRPLGLELPVTGSRGWIVELAAPHDLLRHMLEEEDGSSAAEQDDEVFPTASGFAADAIPEPGVSALLHSAPDGTVVCGASHQASLRAEPEETDAPRRVVERAVRIVPALADTTVRSIRWGIRPMSPDGRPLVGWLREGLFAATGHGPEGVLLGGGTAVLTGALITAEDPPFDPVPFDPLRFD
jgi:glycine/D-amino acid oxidase-like deaminating enzyme